MITGVHFESIEIRVRLQPFLNSLALIGDVRLL